MRRILATGALLLSITSISRPAAACPVDIEYEQPPSVQVGGAYLSSFGTVLLEQQGSRVSGSFDGCGGGTIDGRMIGASITFTWRQEGGAWGRGTWTAGDGTLTGTWGWEGAYSGGGPWDLVPRPLLAVRRR